MWPPQVAAVRAALKRLEEQIPRDHVAHCVQHTIASGNKADQRRKIEELKEALSRAPSAKASRSRARNPHIHKIVIALANAAEEFAERLREGAPQRSRFRVGEGKNRRSRCGVSGGLEELRRGMTTGEPAMSSIYPPATPEIARRRRDLAPNQQAALEALGKAVFADGALPTKTKQIIAVAVAHVTQCPYCINGHTKAALRAGARPEELMEAIWVAAEMRAGAAYAHSTLMLATLSEEEKRASGSAR
jgi:AhpD family alkylhydroperoxidase